jgi:hypothetical protein
MGRDLRERATVVVIRDNKVLLVKDSSATVLIVKSLDK